MIPQVNNTRNGLLAGKFFRRNCQTSMTGAKILPLSSILEGSEPLPGGAVLFAVSVTEPMDGLLVTKSEINDFLGISGLPSRRQQQVIQSYAEAAEMPVVVLLNHGGAVIFAPYENAVRCCAKLMRVAAHKPEWDRFSLNRAARFLTAHTHKGRPLQHCVNAMLEYMA